MSSKSLRTISYLYDWDLCLHRKIGMFEARGGGVCKPRGNFWYHPRKRRFDDNYHYQLPRREFLKLIFKKKYICGMLVELSLNTHTIAFGRRQAKHLPWSQGGLTAGGGLEQLPKQPAVLSPQPHPPPTAPSTPANTHTFHMSTNA